MRLRTLAVLVIQLAAAAVQAHEVRPAYLELRQTSAETYDILWKVPAAGEDLRFGLYLRLPGGIENLTEPRGVFLADSYVERWRVRVRGDLAGEIRVDGLEASATDVLVRVERLDGSTQVTRLLPDNPSFTVEALPSRLQVARTYLGLGVEHILFGVDHLLFVLALLILVKDWGRLVRTITAFTVAHSATLAAATLGVVHLPAPPVEACIALSIVFVAAEIVRSRDGKAGLTQRWPWIVAFGFGLMHGLGFAGALSDIGLPANAIPVALLFFNLGVEIGQLVFIAAAVVVTSLVRRFPIALPAWAWRVPAYAIGGTAAFWCIERIAGF